MWKGENVFVGERHQLNDDGKGKEKAVTSSVRR